MSYGPNLLTSEWTKSNVTVITNGYTSGTNCFNFGAPGNMYMSVSDLNFVVVPQMFRLLIMFLTSDVFDEEDQYAAFKVEITLSYFDNTEDVLTVPLWPAFLPIVVTETGNWCSFDEVLPVTLDKVLTTIQVKLVSSSKSGTRKAACIELQKDLSTIEQHEVNTHPHQLPLSITVSQEGIKGMKDGEVSFWLQEDGDAIFKGDISGSTGTFSGTVTVGSTTQYESGYDPSTKVTEAEAQAVAATVVSSYDSSTVQPAINNLQGQIDGQIMTWFYNYEPTTSNLPASDWNTDAKKIAHLGDIFYNNTTGYCYRWVYQDDTYQWIRVSDEDMAAALAAAAAAQDTADSKRRVFTTQPLGPYDVGDLWAGGSATDLKRCKTATATANYFNAADWELATKYTDDTLASTKRRVFTAQPTVPYDIGDLWTAGPTGDLMKCKTARSSGSYTASEWELASKYTDDTLASSKAKTFYQAAIPTSISIGDFWIDSDDNNKLYRAASVSANEIKTGEWEPVRDGTIAIAQAAAESAASAASAAQNSANTANTLLANIASDSKFTPDEKQLVLREWNGIAAEISINETQATNFGISYTTYQTTFDALADYLNGGTDWTSGTPLWLQDLTTTVDITGSTFRTKFSDYYTARTNLLNAIAAKAKLLADTAQTAANTAQTTANYAGRLGVDSYCKLLAHFDDSLLTHKGTSISFARNSVAYKQDGTQVLSGIPRFENGKFGKALMVEVNTTNLLTVNQSDIETDTTGFNPSNSAVLTRDTTKYRHGLASLKVVTDGAAVAGFYISFSATSGVTYTFSVYIYNTDVVTGAFQLTGTGACTRVDTYPVAPIGSWTRCAITVTATSSGTIGFYVRTSFAATFYADQLQLEVGVHETSWTLGGATRGIETCSIPNSNTILDFAKGTISLWFKPSAGFWNGAYNRLIGHSTAMNTNELQLFRNNTGSTICAATSNSSGTPSNNSWTTVQSTTSFAVDTWYNVVLTWDVVANKLILYINGIKEDEGLCDNYPSVYGTLAIGYHPDATNRYGNGLFDEIRLDGVVRSAEEVKAWYNAQSPFYSSDAISSTMSQLSDIASDNKLTPDEKQVVLKDWTAIAAEYTVLFNQATTFSITTEKTNYTTAFDALADYLNGGTDWTTGTPLWLQDLTTTIDITGTTFRSKFTDYYDKKTALQNAIAIAGKTLADNAATAASNAQTSATNANNLLADIASDSKLTPVEKQAVLNEWNGIASEKGLNVTEASTFGVSSTAYVTTFDALADYLNGGTDWTSGTPLWLQDLTTTTNITGSTFRTKFSDYYTARTNLLNAIAEKAKTLADGAQGTANYAGRMGIDSNCQLLAHFDDSLLTHKATSLTFRRESVAYKQDSSQVAAGLPRYETGKFGKAIMVEEGTTNLLSNPSFENDKTGWSASPSISGLGDWVITTTDKYIGSKSICLTGTGTHIWRGGCQSFTATVGYTYTVSLYGKCDSGVIYGAKVRILKSTDNGATYTQVNEVTTTATSWSRISRSYTAVAGDTNILVDFVSSLGNASGLKVYVDAVQLEVKPYATSYTDGIRQPESLMFPTTGLSPTAGTMSAWIYVNDLSKYYNGVNHRFLLTLSRDASYNTGILIAHHPTLASWRIMTKDDSGNDSSEVFDDSCTQIGWHHFVITWNTSYAIIYVDGVTKATLINPKLPSSFVYGVIGSANGVDAVNFASTLFDEFRVDSVVRSAEEIKAWYNAQSPFYAPESLDNFANVIYTPTVNSLQTQVSSALVNAANAQEAADGEIKGYYQASQPAEYTVLLLHMNGTGQTFVDEMGHTVTAVGNATQTTAQKKWGTASALFDGTGDGLSLADSDDWYWPAAWTVEFEINFNSLVTGYQVIFSQEVDTNNRILFYKNSADNKFVFRAHGSGTYLGFDMPTAPSITTGTWYHFRIVYTGTIFYFFINGVSQTITGAYNIAMPNLAAPLIIGYENTSGTTPNYFFNGYLDEFRISKGIARSTGAFTRPTMAFTPDICFGDIWIDTDGHTPPITSDIYRYQDNMGSSIGTLGWQCTPNNAIGKVFLETYLATLQNTSSKAIPLGNKIYYSASAPVEYTKALIHCWDAALSDTCGKTMTKVGNITQVLTQPKFPNGCMYLDGDGDYLSFPSNSTDYSFDGDFTIECWVKILAFSASGESSRRIFTTGGANAVNALQIILSTTDGTIVVYSNDFLIVSGSINISEWHHIALTRSGTSMKLFIDGVQSGSTCTTSQNFNSSSSSTPYIGRYGNNTVGYFNGYIAEFRISKGIARYTSTFVPSITAFGLDLTAGDYWVSTGDNNRPYRWSGSAWVDVRDTFTVGLGVDSNCSALLHFDDNLLTHKGVAATFTRGSVAAKLDGSQVASGLPRYETGKFGKAMMIEEGTTNLISNANGKLTSMTAGGTTPPTVSSVTDQNNPFGSQCWKIDFPANGSTGYAGSRAISNNGSSLSVSTKYSFTVWIKGMTDNLRVYVTGNEGTPLLTASGKQIGDWYEYRLNGYTMLYGGSELFAFYMLTATTNIQTIYVAVGQMEQKSFATSFINGVRNNEVVTLTDVLGATKGTISAWLKLDQVDGKDGYIFHNNVGYNQANTLFAHAGNGMYTIKVLLPDGTPISKTYNSSVLAANTWQMWTLVYDATVGLFDFYHNGTRVTDGSTVSISTLNINTTLHLSGHLGDPYYGMNGLRDEVRVDKIARTADEIKAWYVSQAPFYSSDAISSAMTQLTDIASDNRLTPDEKQVVLKDWNIILSEKTLLVTQAINFGVSYSAYTTAFDALTDYLNNGSDWTSGTPAMLQDLTTTVTITGSTFRTKFNDYYDAKVNLINAMGTATKTTADTVSSGTAKYRTSGVPTNNPTAGDMHKEVNTDGSINITLEWGAYTQGTNQADNLIMFWKKGTGTGLGAPSINDSSVTFNVNTTDSFYRFEGMASDLYYSFGIAAARRTENGWEIGTIQSPSGWQDVTQGTPDYLGKVAGTAADEMVNYGMGVNYLCDVLLHFNGSLNSHNGKAATFTRNSIAYKQDGTLVASGEPVFENSRFGTGILIEEAITNLLTENQSTVETDTTGFTLYGSGATITRDTSEHRLGSASLKCTTSTYGTGCRTLSTSVTASCTYTASVWLKGSGTLFLYLMEMNSSEGLINTSSTGNITLTSTWTRYSITRTFGSAGVNARIILCSNSANALTVYADCWMLHMSPLLLSWTPGGTPKAEELLSVPLNIANNSFTWHQWTYVDSRIKSIHNIGNFNTIFVIPKSGGSGYIDGIKVCHDNNTAYFDLRIWADGGALQVVELADSAVTTGWHQFVLTCSTTAAILYIDGVEKLRINSPSYPTLATTGYIGGIAGLDHANTYHDEIAVFNYAATAQEVRSWYNAESPFYASQELANLPGYIKIETEGFKVYDAAGNVRAVLGSWLLDAVRKYGLKVINGEIYGSLIRAGGENETGSYIEINKLSTGAKYGYLKLTDSSGNTILEIAAGGDQGAIRMYDAGVEKGMFLINGTTSKEITIYSTDNNGILLLADTGEAIRIGPTGTNTTARGIDMSGNKLLMTSSNGTFSVGYDDGSDYDFVVLNGSIVARHSIYFSSSGLGPILKSPNGIQWRIRVLDDGTLEAFDI